MPTAKTILYKQKTLSDGKHPLMLVVVNDSKVSRFSLGLKFNASEWSFEQNKLKRPRSKDHATLSRFKDLSIKINAINETAESVLEYFRSSNKPFTFKSYKEEFNKRLDPIDNSQSDDIYTYYDKLIAEMKKDNRIGTATSYTETKKALQKFHSANLSFYEIDPDFLKRFERHLRANNGTNGGISVRMRNIRAVLNSAIAEKLYRKEYYPFSKHKRDKLYQIPKTTKNPKALSLEDFDRFMSFDSNEHPHLQKDFLLAQWIYFTRGINFIDLAKLKQSNIINGRIVYKRSKTGKNENIKFTDRHKTILSYFAGDGPYLFPILSEFHQTEDQIKNRVKKCRTKFNKSMREIATIQGIDQNITSYTFRHQYASILLQKGASIDQISRNMNHDNTKVTENYLKDLGFDFEGDKLDEML